MSGLPSPISFLERCLKDPIESLSIHSIYGGQFDSMPPASLWNLCREIFEIFSDWTCCSLCLKPRRCAYTPGILGCNCLPKVFISVTYRVFSPQPAILSCYFPHSRKLHYWAKSTLFKMKFAAAVLLDAGNIPVDRRNKVSAVMVTDDQY